MAYQSPLGQDNAAALVQSQDVARAIGQGSLSARIFFLKDRTESVEYWLDCQNSLLSCLRTGDDESAFLLLEHLTKRFEPTNERVMALRGLYQEAVAADDVALRKILQQYDKILADDPSNFSVAKRRIGLLSTLGRPLNAIEALIDLLKSSPTDVEAWSELANLYLLQSLFIQAAFCLEEILLVAPNSWTVHARLGDAFFMNAQSKGGDTKDFASALKHYCRSVELCEGFLRGWYGVKLSSDRLGIAWDGYEKNSAIKGEHANSMGLGTLRQLNQKATNELSSIVKAGVDHGYRASEIAAANALLHRS